MTATEPSIEPFRVLESNTTRVTQSWVRTTLLAYGQRRLRVRERHAQFLKAGDKVRVDGAEFSEQSGRWGVIDLVYPQIEEGRVIADAVVEGLGEYFVGDRLRVWIASGERPAFVIPADYVKTRFGIDYVQLRRGDATVDVPVQRGRELPTSDRPSGLEILSGIRAGDQLVRP